MSVADPLPVLPEVDLALVHALQVAPRAPWSAIGAVIGVDPATAARRWRRLAADRLAWFVVRPSATALASDRDAAVLWLRCRPGAAARVADRLAADDAVYGVDVIAGRGDLTAVVVGRGLAGLRARIDVLIDDPDITGARTAVIADVYREDAQWQVSVLSAGQRSQLVSPHRSDGGPVDPQVLTRLTEALTEDARMSLADLGRRLGTSEVTARRTLLRALASQSIRLGCDVVASAVGAGRAVVLEAEVADPRGAGRAVAALSPVVRCAAVVGSANLVVMARFGSLAALADFERAAATVVDRWRVVDRSTITHAVKRQGRVLAEDGRLRASSSR